MTDIPETWHVHLRASGRLKLRATSLLADGTREAALEAAVILHQVAAMELRAIEALPSCPPETRLAATIEACMAYVEARDPLSANQMWGRVLDAQGNVREATAKAMSTRITPRFAALHEEFAKAVRGAPRVQAMFKTGAVVARTASERQQARRELTGLVARFPGAAQLWWALYRLAEADGDTAAAWKALNNARRIEPENPRFLALSLLASTVALSRTEADERLADARTKLDGAGAEVCLMYALAEMNLAANGEHKRDRYARALDATQKGLVRVTTERSRAYLKAVQLALLELIAGREPSSAIVYQVGLPELLMTAPSSMTVVDLISAQARMQPLHDAAA